MPSNDGTECHSTSMGEMSDETAIAASDETNLSADQICNETMTSTPTTELIDPNAAIPVDEGFSSVGHQNESTAVDTSLESNNSTNKSQSSDKPLDYIVSSEGVESDDLNAGVAESNCDPDAEQNDFAVASASGRTLSPQSNERQINMHRRFIRKSLDATNHSFYTKNSFIESDAIETEYPRNLDDNIELLSSETEFLTAQLDDKFLQFEASFDIPSHELKEVPIISEDDEEPVGVSPCGRFFKYGKYLDCHFAVCPKLSQPLALISMFFFYSFVAFYQIWKRCRQRGWPRLIQNSLSWPRYTDWRCGRMV